MLASTNFVKDWTRTLEGQANRCTPHRKYKPLDGRSIAWHNQWLLGDHQGPSKTYIFAFKIFFSRTNAAAAIWNLLICATETNSTRFCFRRMWFITSVISFPFQTCLILAREFLLFTTYSPCHSPEFSMQPRSKLFRIRRLDGIENMFKLRISCWSWNFPDIFLEDTHCARPFGTRVFGMKAVRQETNRMWRPPLLEKDSML